MFISSDSIARGVCICRSCRPSYGRTLARFAEFLREKEGKNEPKKEFKYCYYCYYYYYCGYYYCSYCLEFSVFVFVFDFFIIELVKVFKFGQTSLDPFLPL